ncbi:hypothetical protein BDZ45DRAFT_739536 [Acephala macrosclerotiorum]|nr:hypothetical protein BDZ45DRAFT_739536 [Acephala macrosclerotiorum]
MTVQRAPIKPFPRFQNLPVELQDYIWAFACQAPRIVQVAPRPANQRRAPLLLEVTNRRVPAVFHVSHSSRTMALKSYSNLRLTRKKAPTLAYVNNEFDTLVLPTRSVPAYSKGVKSIALPSSRADGSNNVYTAATARKFQFREVLVVIPGSHAQCEMVMEPFWEKTERPWTRSMVRAEA